MLKILVVDDEQDVQMLFTQKYRKEIKNGEFEFHFALSGDEALQYMKSLTPLDLVLVLSDINMPGMTGLELLRQIKFLFPELKVTMVTAYGDKNNYDQAIQLGANDFVTKPVDFDKLKNRILEM